MEFHTVCTSAGRCGAGGTHRPLAAATVAGRNSAGTNRNLDEFEPFTYEATQHATGNDAITHHHECHRGEGGGVSVSTSLHPIGISSLPEHKVKAEREKESSTLVCDSFIHSKHDSIRLCFASLHQCGTGPARSRRRTAVTVTCTASVVCVVLVIQTQGLVVLQLFQVVL